MELIREWLWTCYFRQRKPSSYDRGNHSKNKYFAVCTESSAEEGYNIMSSISNRSSWGENIHLGSQLKPYFVKLCYHQNWKFSYVFKIDKWYSSSEHDVYSSHLASSFCYALIIHVLWLMEALCSWTNSICLLIFFRPGQHLLFLLFYHQIAMQKVL